MGSETDVNKVVQYKSLSRLQFLQWSGTMVGAGVFPKIPFIEKETGKKTIQESFTLARPANNSNAVLPDEPVQSIDGERKTSEKAVLDLYRTLEDVYSRIPPRKPGCPPYSLLQFYSCSQKEGELRKPADFEIVGVEAGNVNSSRDTQIFEGLMQVISGNRFGEIVNRIVWDESVKFPMAREIDGKMTIFLPPGFSFTEGDFRGSAVDVITHETGHAIDDSNGVYSIDDMLKLEIIKASVLSKIPGGPLQTYNDLYLNLNEDVGPNGFFTELGRRIVFDGFLSADTPVEKRLVQYINDVLLVDAVDYKGGQLISSEDDGKTGLTNADLHKLGKKVVSMLEVSNNCDSSVGLREFFQGIFNYKIIRESWASILHTVLLTNEDSKSPYRTKAVRTQVESYMKIATGDGDFTIEGFQKKVDAVVNVSLPRIELGFKV